MALYSFLQHNPWFDGDIILVSDDLKTVQARFLQENFNNLSIQPVNSDLKQAANRIGDALPNIGLRSRIFYNLQIFLQRGYKRLLKLDADMLFRSGIQPIFELESAIAGCPARLMYFQKSRARDNLEVVDINDSRALSFWMNAGMYSLCGKQTSQTLFDQLLLNLTPDFWRDQHSNHTDQILINLHYDGWIEPLSPSYNYLIPDAELIFHNSGVHANDAHVWHYNDAQKPWLLDNLAEEPKRSALLIKAQHEWCNTYYQCMMSMHMKSKLQ